MRTGPVPSIALWCPGPETSRTGVSARSCHNKLVNYSLFASAYLLLLLSNCEIINRPDEMMMSTVDIAAIVGSI